MQRVLIPLAAAAALALGIASPGSAAAHSAKVESNTCPSAPVVAYVTVNVTSDPIAGPSGAIWATGTYVKQIVIYRLGPHTFCAITRDSGTFTTIGGASPNGTGWVAPGVTGNVVKSARSWVFTANWRPAVALFGAVGTITTSEEWLSLFFWNVSGFGDAFWAQQYRTAANGCFNYTSNYGITGDIVSL